MDVVLDFKEGDKIAVLNETTRGVVLTVQGNRVLILDDDGFKREYPSELLTMHADEAEYNLGDELQEKRIDAKLRKVQQSKFEAKNARLPHKRYIDLHIEQLRDNFENMTNFEIVQVQMEACKTFIRRCLNRGDKKIYIIHGKGEGVLKSEVLHFLHKLRIEHDINLEFHDAPYNEFGMGGATEVIIY
ncbi:MAG: Smr/MutS family protein [Flavobacteriales bacterium]|nr:Smr/MutS family protein [Flavobacteriales bacterium]